MKYIDAEKLKTEITRLKGQLIRGACASQTEMETNCKDEAYNEVLAFITSLQQEQPGNICPRCVYRNKTDKLCEYPYGGRICRIDKNGVYECNGFEEIEQQEQPEVDLDKLVNEEFAGHSRTTEYGLEVTYNRAELYQLIKRIALLFNP